MMTPSRSDVALPAAAETRANADDVLHVTFSETSLVIYLADGCVLSVPLVWYPSLLNAELPLRAQWLVVDGGAGIFWPAIGQRLTVAGILRGSAEMP
jgi:hypothetical protein